MLSRVVFGVSGIHSQTQFAAADGAKKVNFVSSDTQTALGKSDLAERN